MAYSRNTKTALSLAGIALGMAMLAYASVPLYRVFCQMTGFGGTTQRAASEPDAAMYREREVTVRFNADTAPTLPWRFAAEQNAVRVHVGQKMLAFYAAENVSDAPATGVATFNVTPDEAGQYFQKIACFCFENQTLAPGQKVTMPVSFYIDPAILDDPDVKNVQTITLSYTFFAAKDEARN